jgi:hypothetical protein
VESVVLGVGHCGITRQEVRYPREGTTLILREDEISARFGPKKSRLSDHNKSCIYLNERITNNKTHPPKKRKRKRKKEAKKE